MSLTLRLILTVRPCHFTARPCHFFTVRPCHFYYCTAVSLFFCTAVSLLYCTAVSLFLLYGRVTVFIVRPCHFFYCTAVSLFYCTAVSLFHCTAVSLFYCMAASRGVHTYSRLVLWNLQSYKVHVSLLATCYQFCTTLCQYYIRFHKVLQNSKQRPPMVTTDIQIYQLRTTPFFVSIKLKTDFWFLFFCLAKKLEIRLAGLQAILL